MPPIPARAHALAPAEMPEASGDAAPTKVQPGTRRPRLLMAAARHGLGEYRRARDLPRLLGHCPEPARALAELCEQEEGIEAARRAGSPAWSCAGHVEVLIAILAERALIGA